MITAIAAQKMAETISPSPHFIGAIANIAKARSQRKRYLMPMIHLQDSEFSLIR